MVNHVGQAEIFRNAAQCGGDAFRPGANHLPDTVVASAHTNPLGAFYAAMVAVHVSMVMLLFCQCNQHLAGDHFNNPFYFFCNFSHYAPVCFLFA